MLSTSQTSFWNICRTAGLAVNQFFLKLVWQILILARTEFLSHRSVFIGFYFWHFCSRVCFVDCKLILKRYQSKMIDRCNNLKHKKQMSDVWLHYVLLQNIKWPSHSFWLTFEFLQFELKNARVQYPFG